MEAMDGKAAGTARIAYLDLVRIIAVVMVVAVHVSAWHLDGLSVESARFAVANSFNSVAFTGVALFVMISGALALNPAKETRIGRVLVHKTLHFFFLYYSWKAFYQVVSMLEKGEAFTLLNIRNDIAAALLQQRGFYHLWFLPMIALMYMAVPVIKKDMASKNTCTYFLCVFFVTALLVPTLLNFEFKFKYFERLLEYFFEYNDFYLFGGYLGYFILGHYLHSWGKDITVKTRRLLYVASIISVVLAGFLSTVNSRSAGQPTYIMNTPFAVTTFFMAAAIFLKAQVMCESRARSEKIDKILNWGAKRAFGIYILHPLALVLLQNSGLDISLYPPILSIPLLVVFTVIVCVPVAAFMSWLPWVRRLAE